MQKYVKLCKTTGDVITEYEISHKMTGKWRNKIKILDDDDFELVLKVKLKERNDSVLREYRDSLHQHLGLFVSLPTLHGFCVERGIT